MELGIGKLLRTMLPVQFRVLLAQSLSGGNIHFSQDAEDIILEKWFSAKKNGFYVDVGAHHPVRFSNTYKYYCKGWSGINIDAMPGIMKLFDKIRPNDTNVETPISNNEEELNFYIFDESALNTFSEEEAEKSKPKYKVVNIQKLKTKKLSEILDKHCSNNQKIDFFSIDTEGFDLKVLQSNNWDKYKPTILIIEFIDKKLLNILDSAIHRYIIALGYLLVAKTNNSAFYEINK